MPLCQRRDAEPAPAMHAPLAVLCAQCVADGVVPDRPGVSHGICAAHLAQMRLTIPLYGVVAALTGPEHLSVALRADLAAKVREVIDKVEGR